MRAAASISKVSHSYPFLLLSFEFIQLGLVLFQPILGVLRGVLKVDAHHTHFLVQNVSLLRVEAIGVLALEVTRLAESVADVGLFALNVINDLLRG